MSVGKFGVGKSVSENSVAENLLSKNSPRPSEVMYFRDAHVCNWANMTAGETPIPGVAIRLIAVVFPDREVTFCIICNILLLHYFFCLKKNSRNFFYFYVYKKYVFYIYKKYLRHPSFFPVSGRFSSHRRFHPQALDAFGLNPHSKLVIGYHWLAFIN